MHLKELKKKTPADLVAMAEEMGVEGASTMRKQDLMFSILKVQAENGVEIMGSGTIEVLNDGFGFLRSPEANYLAGPDDIYVAPSICRRFGLRTGDTVEGEIRGPKEGERYFALTRVTTRSAGVFFFNSFKCISRSFLGELCSSSSNWIWSKAEAAGRRE